MTVVKSAGITDVGRKRKGNEDSFFINDGLCLYVVSDGMGGRQAGEVASRIVTEKVEEQVTKFLQGDGNHNLSRRDDSLTPEGNYLIAAIQYANGVVCETAQNEKSYQGMGATVAAVLISNDTIIAANVGDSPIYLVRNGAIEDLYVPHTVMAEHEALAPKGSKKLGEQFKHMITRAMGISETVEPDIFEIQCFEKDTLVICSDGLSDKVSASEILSMVEIANPEKACNALVNLANERGGDDNITVIALRVENVSEAAASDDDFMELSQPLPVEYDTEDASYKGSIQAINTKGLFIETLEPFDIGQELMLTISDEKDENSFMVTGKISDRKPLGITVEFERLDSDQQVLVEQLINGIRRS